MEDKETKKGSVQLKVFLAIGTVLALFVMTQFITEEPGETKTIPKVTEEPKDEQNIPEALQNVKVAQSMEEVEKFFQTNVTGLKQAEENGAVKKINQQASVPNRDGKFYVDKIWYSEDRFFVFYSIDLSLLEEASSNEYVTLPVMDGFFLEPMEEMNVANQHLKFFGMPETSQSAIIYKDRLYHKGMTSPLHNDQWEPILPLQHMFTATFPLRLPGGYESIEFPMQISYNPEDDFIKSIAINKQMNKNDLQLNIKQLEIGVSNNTVLFELIDENHQLNGRLAATMKTDQSGTRQIYFLTKDRSSGYEGNSEPFNETPEHIDFTLQSYEVRSNENLTDEVDISPIHEPTEDYANEIVYEQTLKEAYGTKIILNRITYNDLQATFHLSYEKLSDSPFLVTPNLAVMHDGLPNKAGEVGNVLTITDEQGEIIQTGPLRIGEDTVSIQVDQSKIKDTNSITINIDNLVYNVYVNETFQIEVD
ncbi:hypothetical protein [Thalassobacillus hwangdonensis]|uniref:Regulatory protein YycH domain-containing protein n=1 Tax=Thalassobacillus hwangdonensis TaxID=546108 RepID=A0ABW3L2F7_9BACI